MAAAASIHPFFTPPLRRTRRSTIDMQSHIGFLDFSAEIRNRIYTFAVVLPFVVRNDAVKRKNMKLRHPDW